MSDIDKIHDKTIKKAFEHKQMTLEFFDQHLPEEVKKIIDLTTLVASKESFIEEDMSAKYCDILFDTKLKDGKAGYIYILLEAQKSNDKFMAFRMMRYMINICSRHLNNNPKSKTLPMIYPMIFWQNDGEYRAKRNIWELFPYPDLAKNFWTNDYNLIDPHQISDKELVKRPWAGFYQLVSKYIKHRDLLKILDDVGGDLLKLIIVENNGKDFIVNAVRYILTVADKSDRMKVENVLKKHLNKGNEIMGTVAQEIFQEGLSQGINQGISQGIEIEKYEIVKNLIKLHISDDQISKATGLAVEEIQKLKQEL